MLWYDGPAKGWEREALPLGNGRPGCMVFGEAAAERIQFNEYSLWVGDEECFAPCAEWLHSVREVRKAHSRRESNARGWTMRAENGIFGGSPWNWKWIKPTGARCAQNLWDH